MLGRDDGEIVVAQQETNRLSAYHLVIFSILGFAVGSAACICSILACIRHRIQMTSQSSVTLPRLESIANIYARPAQLTLSPSQQFTFLSGKHTGVSRPAQLALTLSSSHQHSLHKQQVQHSSSLYQEFQSIESNQFHQSEKKQYQSVSNCYLNAFLNCDTQSKSISSSRSASVKANEHDSDTTSYSNDRSPLQDLAQLSPSRSPSESKSHSLLFSASTYNATGSSAFERFSHRNYLDSLNSCLTSSTNHKKHVFTDNDLKRSADRASRDITSNKSSLSRDFRPHTTSSLSRDNDDDSNNSYRIPYSSCNTRRSVNNCQHSSKLRAQRQ